MRYFYTWRRLFFFFSVFFRFQHLRDAILVFPCWVNVSLPKEGRHSNRDVGKSEEPQRGSAIVPTLNMERLIHIAVPFLAIKSLLSVVQLVYEVGGFRKFQTELAVHVFPFMTVTLLQQHV